MSGKVGSSSEVPRGEYPLQCQALDLFPHSIHFSWKALGKPESACKECVGGTLQPPAMASRHIPGLDAWRTSCLYRLCRGEQGGANDLTCCFPVCSAVVCSQHIPPGCWGSAISCRCRRPQCTQVLLPQPEELPQVLQCRHPGKPISGPEGHCALHQYHLVFPHSLGLVLCYNTQAMQCLNNSNRARRARGNIPGLVWARQEVWLLLYQQLSLGGVYAALLACCRMC